MRIITPPDETATISGSFLADALGTPLFNTLKTIQTFDETVGSGPIDGELTQAQIDFLQSQLSTLDTIHETITNQAAINGSYQRRIDDNRSDLKARQTTIENMMGGVTDVDVAEAISRLQQAQIAVQASAQVFQGLQQSSLLNFLRL